MQNANTATATTIRSNTPTSITPPKLKQSEFYPHHHDWLLKVTIDPVRPYPIETWPKDSMSIVETIAFPDIAAGRDTKTKYSTVRNPNVREFVFIRNKLIEESKKQPHCGYFTNKMLEKMHLNTNSFLVIQIYRMLLSIGAVHFISRNAGKTRAITIIKWFKCEWILYKAVLRSSTNVTTDKTITISPQLTPIPYTSPPIPATLPSQNVPAHLLSSYSYLPTNVVVYTPPPPPPSPKQRIIKTDGHLNTILLEILKAERELVIKTQNIRDDPNKALIEIEQAEYVQEKCWEWDLIAIKMIFPSGMEDSICNLEQRMECWQKYRSCSEHVVLNELSTFEAEIALVLVVDKTNC